MTAEMVAVSVPDLEVTELEERMHDEVLCQIGDPQHLGSAPCRVVASHRVIPCFQPAVNVCRSIVELMSIASHLVPCSGCGRPCSVCWVVSEL